MPTHSLLFLSVLLSVSKNNHAETAALDFTGMFEVGMRRGRSRGRIN